MVDLENDKGPEVLRNYS